MLKGDLPEDIEERINLHEWNYLQEKYPHVAFNVKPDRPRRDGTKLAINSPEHGFRHLLQLEPYNGMSTQWDPEVLQQYYSVITWSSNFYRQYWADQRFNVYLIRGCTFFNDFYLLDEFVPYEEKIDGVCFVNKCYPSNVPDSGHIANLREQNMFDLHVEPMVKHVYSPVPWGGKFYQGPTKFHQPNHIECLKLFAKYKFRVCFESLYHPIWSWDFMTDRLFECFKAKTVPIYLGCYNIQEHVPTDFYIDVREYLFDRDDGTRINWEGIANRIKTMSKKEYVDMTDAAYEWVLQNDIGSVKHLELVLKGLS
jgi:hypothetical protein